MATHASETIPRASALPLNFDFVKAWGVENLSKARFQFDT